MKPKLTISTFELFSMIPDAESARQYIEKRRWPEVGSTIYSDDHRSYSGLDGLLYRHATVNHSSGEYARDGVCTNGIESVWAVLKRGINGVYHHVSPKHLNRYVGEFTFRLNDGNVQRHSLDRLASLLKSVIGKHLTWDRLTGGAQ